MAIDYAALAAKLLAALTDPTVKAEVTKDVADVKAIVADIQALVATIESLSA